MRYKSEKAATVPEILNKVIKCGMVKLATSPDSPDRTLSNFVYKTG